VNNIHNTLAGILKTRENVVDIGANGRIILKCISDEM
jgi:hypothetical protein